MRKHTLHINPLNLCPPSSNHFSLFSTKNFLLLDASIIQPVFMQVLHVFARSVLKSQFDIYPVCCSLCDG